MAKTIDFAALSKAKFAPVVPVKGTGPSKYFLPTEGKPVVAIYHGYKKVGRVAAHQVETADGMKMVKGTRIVSRLLKAVAEGTAIRLTFLGVKGTDAGQSIEQWSVEALQA